jgi:hypothetical protein
MDNYINCDVMKAKVKLPSNAEVVILEHSGHLGFIEEEDLSVRMLGSFIRTVAGSRKPRAINSSGNQ